MTPTVNVYPHEISDYYPIALEFPKKNVTKNTNRYMGDMSMTKNENNFCKFLIALKTRLDKEAR